MKIVAIVIAGLGITSLAACGGIAFVPAGSPVGIIQSTSTSKAVASSTVGTKKGEACAFSILQLVTLGDASVAKAAQNGGIGQISIVDNDDLNILGFYSKHCAVVTGS
jgi:TRL-like protein family